MAHSWPAMRAVPWGVQLSQIPHNLAHGLPVQVLADHDGGSTGSHGQHRPHPAENPPIQAFWQGSMPLCGLASSPTVLRALQRGLACQHQAPGVVRDWLKKPMSEIPL